MAVVATFETPAAAFPLGETLDAIDARIEIERIVPTGDTVLPFFWAIGPDAERVPETVPEHQDATITRLDSIEDAVLYRAALDDRVPPIVAALDATGVALLEATSGRDGWTIRVRGTDGDSLSAFRDHCAENGIEIELRRLDKPTLPRGANAMLTDPQRAALTLAFERGYYDRPRNTSLAELGEALGVSRQAVGNRLRRAHRTLVGAALDSLSDGT